MQSGSNVSKIVKRRERWLALEKVGGCHFCGIHRGENVSRSVNHRWVDGVKVDRKGKDRK